MSKTIFHLVYHFGGRGAVEARAAFDAVTQAKAGHKVVIITDHSAAPAPPGVEVISSGWRIPEPTRELIRVAALAATLRKALSRNTPDSIVFHSGTLGWPAIRTARRIGALSVYVVHAQMLERIQNGGSPFGPLRTRFYLSADRHSLHKSDRIINVSRYMSDFAKTQGVSSEKMKTVPNVFRAETAFSEPSDRDVDIVFAGRFAPEKGLDVLVKALGTMPTDLKVMIIGDGPLRDQLLPKIAKLPMHVQTPGWVPRDKLLAIFRRSKILVVPSRSEPQGVVVLEGMSAGAVVVGSRAGGIPEMVSHGDNGFLFAVDDAAELRSTLATALETDLFPYATRAYDTVTRYSPESIYDLTLSSYVR